MTAAGGVEATIAIILQHQQPIGMLLDLGANPKAATLLPSTVTVKMTGCMLLLQAGLTGSVGL